MEREALQFLKDNLEQFKFLVAEDSASELVALSVNTKIESLEQYQEKPNRIKRQVKMLSCDSFTNYINRFKNAETSVYLDVDQGKFGAMLDHYGTDSPSWCDHAVGFEPKLSLEWAAWCNINDQKLSQLDLAHFIEGNLNDIVKPEPNVMLKAALKFQSNENLAFSSAMNLDDGSVKFNFTKDNVSKSLTFPHRIMIRIPVHENQDQLELELRVRYKTSTEGVLSFKMSLVESPRKIERDALLTLAEIISSNTEDLRQYEGSM